MARLSEHGIRLSSMSPSFLNSNSTSHTWPFSAVAELVDNASDPGVMAKHIWIDVAEESSVLCMTFTDNGSGMTPNKLHKMLSFGFTEKGSGKASHQAIGVYGNGFKSGSMRLGRDALIFTKNGGCQTVGMLSQTYLENIKAQAVIVPIVPFNQQTKSLVVTEDSEASLAAILQNSILTSVEQIHAHFDSIPSKKGTKILIWNIRRAKDGKPEIDFTTDKSDFRLPEIQIEELKKGLRSSGSLRAEQNIPDMHYSLRAYLSILYLKPRTQVILRGVKVLAKLVSKRLKHIEHDVYKPHFSKDKVKVTFGLNPKNRDHYGIMMYHKNRLIKAYEKVGCQLKTSGQRSGVGVIGVIECNFLKPAHNKQDFEYTKEYRLTLGALGLKLNNYWQEVTEKKAREREFQALDRDEEEQDTVRGPVWLQCEECLKWRSVPEDLYKEDPETWTCSQNPNPRYRSCSSPEEESEEQLTPSYQKNHRKQEHPKGRKREKSLETCTSQDGEAKREILSRCSSEPSQPTHSPQHQSSTDRCPSVENTLDPDESDTELKADYLTDAHAEDATTVTQSTTTDEVSNTQQEPARKATVIKTKDGPEQAQDEVRDTETVEENPNLLRLKRKLGSLFSYAKKKPCLSEEQKEETHPERQRHEFKRSEGESSSSWEEKRGDTAQRTPTSLSWTHTSSSTQTVKVSPLSRTVSRSIPPDGGDRDANMQKLTTLEKEAQRLRKFLGLEVTKVSQSTMTESESGAGRQEEGMMKLSAATAVREVGCQTEESETCSSSSLAQAPRLQGPLIQGQRALCGSKEQPSNTSVQRWSSRTWTMFDPHTAMIATLLPLLLFCCPAVEAQEDSVPGKHYYIAAVEIGWDYIHLDDADPVPEQRGKRTKDIPQKYIKAVYREYTDSTYTVPKPREAWSGIQGPVIMAQAFDRVVVHFKNLASQPYSISPVGISYWKLSEGAGYDDSTTGQEKDDDAVPPGGYYEYVWEISTKDSPTINDPECLTYSYSSQVDPVRDINSGLIGALLICKSSAFSEDGKRRYSAFVLLFAVFDETKSWYGEVGERKFRERFKRSSDRKEYHTINGYVNSTLPGLKVCQSHSHVFWHLIGMGTAPEIHSIQFQDHTLQVLNHRRATMEVTPMTFITAEMRPATIGRFLISCQIHSHRHDGMDAVFEVEKCAKPPGPDMRKVDDDSVYDDYDDMFNTITFQKPRAQARSYRGEQSQTWKHFIAIEEVTWDYAGHLKPTDSKLQSEYLPAAPHHLGYRYKKVAYVEYTDSSFTQRKSPDSMLQGPLLKGKVNDQIHITLRNMADRPFNIYPNGITQIHPLDQSSEVKDLRSMGVPPNGTFTYVWRLTVDDGPLKGDPPCLTQLYQSTVNPERDLASGLVGTLLICTHGTIDTRGRLFGPDKELSVMFAVFDENRSWYFNETMQNSSQINPKTTDPEFYNSNVIFSVNGIMFNRRQFALRKTDVTFWHVVNVGTQSDFLSVYFTGNLFQYQGLHQSVLTLFPMTGVTVTMEPEVIGEWEISAFDNSLKERGMSVLYTVVHSTTEDREDEDDDISEYIDQLSLQARSRRSHNSTVLVRVCNNSTQSVNTSGLNVPEGVGTVGPSGCQLKEVMVTSAEEADEEIPLDVLEQLDGDMDWTKSKNRTDLGEERAGRQKRRAEGNWTDVEISSGASEDGATEMEIEEQAVKNKTFTSEEVEMDLISEMLSSENGTKEELEENNEIVLDKDLLQNSEILTQSEEMDENQILSEHSRRHVDQPHVEFNLTAEDINNTAITYQSLEYDDYDQEVNGTFDGTDYINPRSGEARFTTYYIAAEEITWDYGVRKPHQLIKPREMRRGMRKFLPEYKKVVYRAYWDRNFDRPMGRGELQEHLGIMGPVIRAEINERFTVIFMNKASRPYSFHLHGVYDYTHAAGITQNHSPDTPPGVPGEPVPPGEARTYNWRITRTQGPSESEFDCKAGAYYSTVNKERDLHSGLIGPLLICKPDTLKTRQKTQPDVQEFSLLFHMFDETKSWYMEENLRRYCAPPCEVNTEDPWYHVSNKFAAINGYVAETLPGLLAAQNQQVRWHLLNVGGDEEYHAVHFHGLPFTVHTKEEHRMGVYNLYPGVFGTVEMKPPNVGTWLVENTIGEYQLAGMRAKLLVYNPKCSVPLGMKSGRIEDSQITASDHIDSWLPSLARLDQSGYINAWMGRNMNSWLQVDLLRPTLLHGVQTQGVRSRLRDHFIRLFKISYSLDKETWTTYRGNDTRLNHRFHGNFGSSNVRQNHLIPPIIARYVRIQPLDYKRRPALRMELMGCDLNSCSLPLGLQKNQASSLPDGSFYASSNYSFLMRNWGPHFARLHLEGSTNAWRPKSNNPHEWLQVDLGTVKRITGVITQGARSLLTQMMVTEFSVTVSRDGHSWNSVLEESSQKDKIFQGNNDPDEEAFNAFNPPLFGKFLRIHPRGWINDIALRMELLGCDTQQ